jgi:predicted nucleotide-binding protein
MGKPSLFIGSSTEGLEFARALRSLLVHDAEVTIWNEGFFGLGSTFIETLVNSLPRFDFAVLILTGDDLLSSRDAESLGPRDNVLFELGLFMGRLGRSRTFILHQSNARLKIPSDLSGMTTATYEWPREDRSYRSAVGPACDSIRDVVRDLGVSDAKTARDISDIKSRQEELQQRQAEQQRDRSADKRTISGSVTRRT